VGGARGEQIPRQTAMESGSQIFLLATDHLPLTTHVETHKTRELPHGDLVREGVVFEVVEVAVEFVLFDQLAVVPFRHDFAFVQQ
jgi:hypothetical protein